MREKRTEVVTLRLRPTAAKVLRQLADDDRRPFASLCSLILEDYAEAKQREQKAGRK